MEFGVESLLLGIFLVLPGFLASAIQRIFSARAFGAISDWVGVSVLRSMAFTVVASSAHIIIVEPVDFAMPLSDVPSRLETITLGSACIFLGILYLLSVTWGILAGIVSPLSLHRLAFLMRWTSVSHENDVWHQALNTRFRTKINSDRGTDEKEVPWILVNLSDTRVVAGRMQFSSVIIEQEKPIEIYLSPVFHVTDTGLKRLLFAEGRECEGLYVKLTDAMQAAVFSAPSNWIPEGVELSR